MNKRLLKAVVFLTACDFFYIINAMETDPRSSLEKKATKLTFDEPDTIELRKYLRENTELLKHLLDSMLESEANLHKKKFEILHQFFSKENIRFFENLLPVPEIMNDESFIQGRKFVKEVNEQVIITETDNDKLKELLRKLHEITTKVVLIANQQSLCVARLFWFELKLKTAEEFPIKELTIIKYCLPFYRQLLAQNDKAKLSNIDLQSKVRRLSLSLTLATKKRNNLPYDSMEDFLPNT